MSILKGIGICNKVHKLLKWYKTFMVLNLIFWILVNCHSEDCMMTLRCVKWTSCLPRWSFTFTSLRSFLCFSCTQKHSTDEHNIVYSYFSITNKSKNLFLCEMSFCLQSERYYEKWKVDIQLESSSDWATSALNTELPPIDNHQPLQFFIYSDRWFFTFLFYA